MKRYNVTTPVHFRVVEGSGAGSFRIAIEFADASLPAELNDALISIYPTPGVSFERAQEVARILRECFHETHYHHPIQ